MPRGRALAACPSAVILVVGMRAFVLFVGCCLVVGSFAVVSAFFDA
jgi:hypothetical protein